MRNLLKSWILCVNPLTNWSQEILHYPRKLSLKGETRRNKEKQILFTNKKMPSLNICMSVYVCHICHFQLTVYGLLVDNKFILLHLYCKILYVTQMSVFHLYHACRLLCVTQTSISRRLLPVTKNSLGRVNSSCYASSLCREEYLKSRRKLKKAQRVFLSRRMLQATQRT